MKPFRHRLRYVAACLALLLLGLWLAGTALWQLGQTAHFAYKAVVVPGVVVDVRQKPFETWAETLGAGNLALPGDVSYQPWVRFTLPGGISAFRADLPADKVNYDIGQPVSIISLPDNPASAQLNQGKFLWGAGSMRLGAGLLITLLGYALLRRLKGRRAASSSEARSSSKASRTSRWAEGEEPPPPAKPKRTRKKATAAEGGEKPAAPRKRKKAEAAEPGSEPAPKKPRTRKKAESAEGGEPAPKKPRTRRKKAEESPELPLI